MNAIDIMVKEHEVITRMLKIIRKISLNILNNTKRMSANVGSLFYHEEKDVI